MFWLGKGRKETLVRDTLVDTLTAYAQKHRGETRQKRSFSKPYNPWA